MRQGYRKKWLVIVDGTQTYSGSRRLNEGCLERHYKKGTEETVNYHCDVLEAKKKKLVGIHLFCYTIQCVYF